MKLFRVDLDNYGCDEFDGCIVAANSEKEAFEHVTKDSDQRNPNYDDWFFIHPDQNITITEIKLDEFEKPIILLSSFNAG